MKIEGFKTLKDDMKESEVHMKSINQENEKKISAKVWIHRKKFEKYIPPKNCEKS